METNGKLWEINGISLPLDLSDADVMARYEDAFEAMKHDETDIPRDGRASERIRGYCRMYRNLYDRLFGEGTAARIFDGQFSDLCDRAGGGDRQTTGGSFQQIFPQP